MNKETTTFGLNAEQLAQLWSLGKENQTEPMNAALTQKADRLLDRLAQKMPMQEVLAQVLPQTLARLCQDIKPFEGDSLHALVMAPNTDLTVLQQIKAYVKKQTKCVTAQDDRDVLAVIYYSAIASALVHHGHLITSFSLSHIHQKLKSLQAFAWLTSDIRTLFDQAITYIQTHTPI